MTGEPIKADAKMYARVFEGHAEAAMVLDDLTKRFGGALFVKGGEEGRRQTDFNLGRRFVLDFILTIDRKSTRLNSSHSRRSRMPSSA